jgi:hypothetical protein
MMVIKQARFTFNVAILIMFAFIKGYHVTLGDAARIDNKGHRDGSFHYKRLAIDLNLFKDGKYLTETKDHEPLGKFWKFLGGTWGGDWEDGNHYSWGEK